MHRCEETTVQPTPTLTDQLRHLIRHIRHGVGTLDIVQNPASTAFGNQLPTKNTIFSEVHVGGENIGAGSVHGFAKEVLLQRTFACDVVLECDIAVGTERARQDSDIAEDRLPIDGISKSDSECW